MTIKINEDGIDREATEQEIEQIKADQIAEKELVNLRRAEADAKASTKAALLARLSLTEEEAKLLLG
jgi:hypothetical protein